MFCNMERGGESARAWADDWQHRDSQKPFRTRATARSNVDGLSGSIA